MLRMTRTVDLTDRTNVPLAVYVYVSKVMAFKACLLVARVVAGEGGINRYAMDGSRGINFKGGICGLVMVVSLVTYCSTLLTNLGICNW